MKRKEEEIFLIKKVNFSNFHAVFSYRGHLRNFELPEGEGRVWWMVGVVKGKGGMERERVRELDEQKSHKKQNGKM